MLDFKKIDKEILEYWEKEKVYDKLKERNRDGEKFYFLQGPPYTSGRLHIAHAWNNSLKDMILRYKRMRGFNVWDRAGYDMHGLPTENKVQEKLGFKNKDEIIAFGIDKFVKECLNFSIEHAEYMSDDLWKLGVWMDYKNAYMPVKKEFISGEWAFIKKAWEQKRLYKGKKVMHWDAETETSLAKHELEYKTIKDKSIFLKFNKKGKENEYFVIWTTTPWTIPYNLAIMVNPEIEYVDVKVDNEIWTIAKDLSSIFISGLLGKDVDIVKSYKGKELEGQEYIHPLYDELKETYDSLKKEWPNVHTIILSEDFVDTSAGSGLVHCAPGSGPEDQEVGAKYGIGTFNTLNERGECENLGKYTGWTAKVDDNKFIEELENKEALITTTDVEHEYPHSWRSHKPVVFRTTEQWFLKIEDLIPNLLSFSNEVHWSPNKVKTSHDRWLENLKDNGVTRQRFWGCPMPLWINEENEDDFIVVGSAEELEELTGKKLDDMGLHRPWIDDVLILKNGKKYRRIPDVIDVWIDSGTTSWNCLYNDPKLIEKYFPADFILEATEMTRLWFSMLQICSAIHFGKTSFKNIFVHGMLLDIHGVKMSKSIGNIISPYEVIDKYSADILRYYMCQVNAGENINFSWDDIKVKQRNLIILENISKYIVDLEKQEISDGDVEIEEKWILSRLNSTLEKVTNLFEEYRLDETIGEIENLFMSLSRDYIKFVRYKSNTNKVVLKTIKEIFLGVLKMFSTICPFITDHLWRKLGEKESVHLCNWPKVEKEKIDKELEEEVGNAFLIIEEGLSIRDKERVGLKWPLSKANIFTTCKIRDEVKDIISRQLNVKEIEIDDKEKTETNQGRAFQVKLDLKMTPILEAEGFSREIARRVQAERKKKGMQKSERINLKISIDKEMIERLKPYLEFIKKRTGSTDVNIADEIVDDGIEFEVKNRKISISF